MADNESPEYEEKPLYYLTYLALTPMGRSIGDVDMQKFDDWWGVKSENVERTKKARKSKTGMKSGKELMKLKLGDQSTNKTKTGVSW